MPLVEAVNLRRRVRQQPPGMLLVRLQAGGRGLDRQGDALGIGRRLVVVGSRLLEARSHGVKPRPWWQVVLAREARRREQEKRGRLAGDDAVDVAGAEEASERRQTLDDRRIVVRVGSSQGDDVDLPACELLAGVGEAQPRRCLASGDRLDRHRGGPAFHRLLVDGSRQEVGMGGRHADLAPEDFVEPQHDAHP